MDREAAGTVAALFIDNDDDALSTDPKRTALANPLARSTKTAPQMISEGPFVVVAGTGFEPVTSGL